MSTNDLVTTLPKEKPDVETTINDDSDDLKSSNRKIKEKVQWYYAPAFLLFWLTLFFAVTIPVFFHLPTGLRIANEKVHPNEFIAERAQLILLELDRIGPKAVGSFANENITVQLLMDEVEKIRSAMQYDLFELELDVQVVSGTLLTPTMIFMYQSVQNIVVKLSTKNSTSESYLLMNSHFDSKPGSPGTGDAGAMVVVMLEILRVLATNQQTFEHPIVFLFNGAEERALLGSHGFITQHKWARNCKAVINLDSAGSGHKEILFQSTPNHTWLMEYYNKHIKYPYATSLAEELFQGGVIPSGTDFLIFRTFAQLPGLDIAHSYNGYVYHTRFDKFNVIPRGTLQSTGDNMLALVRGLANAPELDEPPQETDENTIFFDFMGLFFVFYTEKAGTIVNICLAVAGILIVGISLWRMAVTSHLTLWHVLRAFAIVFTLHVIGLGLAVGLPLLMSVFFDSTDRGMTWYTSKWLVIGLYIVPALFGLCLPTMLYLSFERNNKLTQSFKTHMVLHAHCVSVAVCCIVLTIIGYRATYLLMISLLFYIGALIINLLTTLYERPHFWTIVLALSQIMPFLYFTYLMHALLCTLIPMMGRYGTTSNPDFIVSLLCAVGAVVSMGFLIPLLNLFRRPRAILISMAILIFIFSMIALTHVGFPYRAKTTFGRLHLMHVRRVFYGYDESISRDESGFYFEFQDRRAHHPIEEYVDLSEMQSMNDTCAELITCDIPLFDIRMIVSRKEGKWLPANEPVLLPGTPTLTLLNRTTNATTQTAHYEFELSGPSHMSIFIKPAEGVTIIDWSFLKTYLLVGKPPYNIFFTYGKLSTPLKFFFDIRKNDSNFDEPLLEIAISGHYIESDVRSAEGQQLIHSFPDFFAVLEWPSSYESYLF